MAQLKEKSTEELLEMLANATKTHYNCNGHGKAERNEAVAGNYKRELTNRGVEIPSVDTLLSTGIFNGNGSC